MPSKFCQGLFGLFVLFFASCTVGSDGVQDQNVASSDSTLVADLKYIDDFFDFGTVCEGEVISHTFKFKNAGNGVLIVKDAIPSCGCTTPKLSKKMLKPGEEGSVEVIFDSRGWFGSQYKSVTLRTNSHIMDKSVTIKANVVEGNITSLK
ncbi:hypothetical protein CYCD_27400 [Tenuifilaceae bacterium CYCD]|nr:hypothetical protein CYCD_27400 [Tenuifilaceae bacterium CYCD]